MFWFTHWFWKVGSTGRLILSMTSAALTHNACLLYAGQAAEGAEEVAWDSLVYTQSKLACTWHRERKGFVYTKTILLLLVLILILTPMRGTV